MYHDPDEMSHNKQQLSAPQHSRTIRILPPTSPFFLDIHWAATTDLAFSVLILSFVAVAASVWLR